MMWAGLFHYSLKKKVLLLVWLQVSTPPKNICLLENSNLFDPWFFFPFVYQPVSCFSTTSDLVVPKIEEAIEDKCFKTSIQAIERKSRHRECKSKIQTVSQNWNKCKAEFYIDVLLNTHPWYSFILLNNSSLKWPGIIRQLPWINGQTEFRAK